MQLLVFDAAGRAEAVGWAGGRATKILSLKKNVDLAIRSEGGDEQVATEISFMLSPKMIAGANCHHAARRARDHPYLARELSDGEI
jgi:hypothetical protein